MKAAVRTIGVSQAKAHFLALVTEVEKKGRTVRLTRGGREVAEIVPLKQEDPLAKYKIGGGRIVGDIDAPANDPADWEYD